MIFSTIKSSFDLLSTLFLFPYTPTYECLKDGTINKNLKETLRLSGHYQVTDTG